MASRARGIYKSIHSSGQIAFCELMIATRKKAGLTQHDVANRLRKPQSFEAVEFATLEWVDWFNNRRLLEPIGNMPPAEAEERYYAMLEQPAMAA
jgi:transposase InsO family protein